MRAPQLGAKPARHQGGSHVGGAPGGQRAGERPGRGATQWGERHIADEQQARGGADLRADQSADDRPWGTGCRSGWILGL